MKMDPARTAHSGAAAVLASCVCSNAQLQLPRLQWQHSRLHASSQPALTSVQGLHEVQRRLHLPHPHPSLGHLRCISRTA